MFSASFRVQPRFRTEFLWESVGARLLGGNVALCLGVAGLWSLDFQVSDIEKVKRFCPEVEVSDLEKVMRCQVNTALCQSVSRQAGVRFYLSGLD